MIEYMECRPFAPLIVNHILWVDCLAPPSGDGTAVRPFNTIYGATRRYTGSDFWLAMVAPGDYDEPLRNPERGTCRVVAFGRVDCWGWG